MDTKRHTKIILEGLLTGSIIAVLISCLVAVLGAPAETVAVIGVACVAITVGSCLLYGFTRLLNE